MKLRFYERALIAAFALVVALGVILLALTSMGLGPIPLETARYIMFSGDVNIIRLAICVLLVIWAGYAAFVSLKFNRSRHTGFVSIKNSDSGEVQISVAALHSLASKAVAGIEGVVCRDVRVIEHQDSISLKLKMTIKGDHNIPAATAEMQRAIRAHIESQSGIAVREVRIVVTDIISTPGMFVTHDANKPEAPVEEIYYPDEDAPEGDAENTGSAPEGELPVETIDDGRPEE